MLFDQIQVVAEDKENGSGRMDAVLTSPLCLPPPPTRLIIAESLHLPIIPTP